jgi:LCP family protein required for cell wall assembly
MPEQGGRRSGRLSGPGESPRRPSSRPPTGPLFREEDDRPYEDGSPPPPRGGLVKSPLPEVPDVPARRRAVERFPDEDEALDTFDRPPRRRRDYEGDAEAPRRRRRNSAGSIERESPALPGKKRGSPSKKRTNRPPRTILRVVLAVFLLAACSTTAFALTKVSQYYQALQIVQRVTGKALPTVNPNGRVQATALPDTLSGVKSFNMLLLGSDNDAKFSSGAVLTQTDIVVRIDLEHHKVTMVSIPRDMWISTESGACCYKLDEISGAETSGPSTPLLNGLAHTVASVENDFGIPISAYAWVGLQGFVNVINTLGGVDVDVLHPIQDDTYPKDLDPNGDPYAYQRLYIPAGPQHLDGEQALNYVRSRHSDLTGDFGRSARQQSVLVALKKKLDSGTILNNLNALADDLKDSVITSLTIPQVLSLANFAKDLKPTDIIQKVLAAPDYGQPTTINGKYVIDPNWDAINATIKEVFDTVPPVVKLHGITSSDKQTVTKEAARILIENGTSTSGVANQLADVLKSEGFNVVQTTNADRQTYQATLIQEFIPSSGTTAFDGTCTVLSKLLGSMHQISSGTPPDGVDVVIIVGSDTAAQIQQQA